MFNITIIIVLAFISITAAILAVILTHALYLAFSDKDFPFQKDYYFVFAVFVAALFFYSVAAYFGIMFIEISKIIF